MSMLKLTHLHKATVELPTKYVFKNAIVYENLECQALSKKPDIN